MTDSQALLAEYVRDGSEKAFRELVARYIDLVYSTALRFMEGDTYLAQDAAQNVFIHLARKADSLGQDVMLGGWLHRDTCHVAATMLRSERRRRSRERRAAEMNDDSSGNRLESVAPILDEAIDQLGSEDRAAILLRFYEQRDFRSVGAALGSSEDAARMRVSRALEKLHSFLKHRGVTLSVAALGAALADEAVTAAPAGLAASVAAGALAGGVAGGGISATIVTVITMTKITAGNISGLLVAGVATPFVLQQQTQNRLRAQNDSLRAQVAQIPQLEAENARLSNLVSETKTSLPNSQMDELLRLRGQVGNLKQQLAEAAQAAARLKQQAKDDAQAANDMAQERDALRKTMIVRMNDAKQLMLAFYKYAGADGQLPTNIDQVASQLPQTVDTNLFQIVYRGSISSLTNPASTIVVREIEAHPTPDGTWVRTYGFADGHSEVHTSADGDFSAWEQQHGVTPQ